MKIVAMAGTMPTYYDVLQVERDAPPERVRAAYRKLAQKYHPDKMPGNANAVRAMAAINAAYEVLSDTHRRAEHDLWIRRAERPSQPAPQRARLPDSVWAYLHPAQHWPCTSSSGRSPSPWDRGHGHVPHRHACPCRRDARGPAVRAIGAGHAADLRPP